MAAPAQARRDPLVSASALVLWLLLAPFVRLPAGDDGRAHAGAADRGRQCQPRQLLTNKHQVRAFGNSLLLATLVGLIGTVTGFVFAFTAARAKLPPWLQRAIDASVLLPLVSPPVHHGDRHHLQLRPARVDHTLPAGHEGWVGVWPDEHHAV